MLCGPHVASVSCGVCAGSADDASAGVRKFENVHLPNRLVTSEICLLKENSSHPTFPPLLLSLINSKAGFLCVISKQNLQTKGC